MKQVQPHPMKCGEMTFARGDGPAVRYRWLFIFLAAGYLLLSSTGALALETTLEVAAGYDDNAAEVSDAEGSGMVRYLARLLLPVLAESDAPDLNVYLEGMYNQYFSLDDSHQLRAGTELLTAPWNNRLRAVLFAEAVMYRDNLVAEDDQNALLVGAGLQWLADARLTLSLQQTYSRVDYQNPVSLPGQRSYAVDRGRGKGSGGQGPSGGDDEWITLSRNDTLWTTEAMATYAMSPDVQVDISVLYCGADSSDAYESYRELGGFGQLSWYYSEFLEFFASGYWSKLDYDDVPEGDDRSDDAYGFTLGASRSLGALELFARYDRSVNESPVVGEDYRKSVVLCGVSYTF